MIRQYAPTIFVYDPKEQGCELADLEQILPTIERLSDRAVAIFPNLDFFTARAQYALTQFLTDKPELSVVFSGVRERISPPLLELLTSSAAIAS
ncbi:MAG: hypothetical protein AB4426_06755 [Xenococcaceae cyanobacterium]